jgi:hypothetical protein
MGWSINHKQGLLHHDASRAFQGYTLISMSGGLDSRLVDMEGRVCHTWHRDEGLAYGFLLNNGNLLARTKSSAGGSRVAQAALIAGESSKSNETGLLELDWDGNIVWQYWHQLVHHDFERLPNGNTLAVHSELLPPDFARGVRGGRGSLDEPMYGDVVREIDHSGSTVNEWKIWQALDRETDIICPLEPRDRWLHQNALSLTPEGDLLVSFRQIDTIGIVDRLTGKFKWKWGPGKISHQHHPTCLPSGSILLFDNGPHRGDTTYSRVIEVDPVTNQIEWEYTGDPPISFYSFHISGAERQPNGTTLVTEGAPGRIFEVTADGEIVWEFLNPHRIPSGVPTGSGAPTSVFRAHRYSANHPAFVGKVLDPQ